MMVSDMTAVRLELVAAKAKQLAEDVKHGRLWPGDLKRGIQEIQEQLAHASRDAHNDR